MVAEVPKVGQRWREDRGGILRTYEVRVDATDRWLVVRVDTAMRLGIPFWVSRLWFSGEGRSLLKGENQ